MFKIVSLFDYSGNWSRPYRENGYEVIQVDLKLGIDIFQWTPPNDVYGVLAAPPCDHFCVGGATHWKKKDLDGRTQRGIAIIERTLELIGEINPSWWCLENPPGRLRKLTCVGEPSMWFQPYWYAGWNPQPDKDRYSKRTYLWGKFNTNLQRKELEPTNRDWVNSIPGGNKVKQKEIRSTTPLGFAYAFYEANK